MGARFRACWILGDAGVMKIDPRLSAVRSSVCWAFCAIADEMIGGQYIYLE